MTLTLTIMLLTYFAVLTISALILTKAFRRELKAIADKGRIRVFSRFSRFSNCCSYSIITTIYLNISSSGKY